MQTTRLRREAEFHDERFAEHSNTRSSTNRFYNACSSSYKRYNDLVRENAVGVANVKKTVLEYGCGPGSLAMSLAASVGSELATLYGIDISSETIKTATAKGSSCKFLVMNAEEMTFPSSSFDLVYGSGILHHLNLSRAFNEISRTLLPGGRAIFIEPMGHNPIINLYRNRTPEMRTVDEHPLLAQDLQLAKQYFRVVSTEFFHLFGLGAVFIPTQFVRCVLDKLDNIILDKRSPFRFQAWIVVLVLEK